MLYLITYDLKTPGKDYQKLYDCIKGLGAWWHHLDSTWIVDTSLSASQVSDKIKSSIDNNDNLLVVKFSSNYSGWLPEKAWEWIKSRQLATA